MKLISPAKPVDLLNEPSAINEVNENNDLIREWIGAQNISLKLAYRGSQHGFTIASILNRIFGKGPTISFI